MCWDATAAAAAAASCTRDSVENASRENIPRLFPFVIRLHPLFLARLPSVRADLTSVLSSVHLRLYDVKTSAFSAVVADATRAVVAGASAQCQYFVVRAALAHFASSPRALYSGGNCAEFQPLKCAGGERRRVNGTAAGTGERARAGMHVSLVTLRPACASDAMAVHTGGAGTDCIRR